MPPELQAYSLPSEPLGKTSIDYLDLCWQSNESAFKYVVEVCHSFSSREPHLSSWLQSPSAVIVEPKKIKSVTVSIVSPSVCHEEMGPDAMILVFLNVEF